MGVVKLKKNRERKIEDREQESEKRSKGERSEEGEMSTGWKNCTEKPYASAESHLQEASNL